MPLRKRPLKPRGTAIIADRVPNVAARQFGAINPNFQWSQRTIFKALVFMKTTREVMNSDQALHTSDFIAAPFKAQSLALCVAFFGMHVFPMHKRPLRTWRLKSACRAIDAISRSLLGGL